MQVSVREQIEIFIAWSRLITITDREATVSFCNSRLLAQRALVGTRSRASRRRLSDNDIRWSASDRQWFPARPAQHVHRRRNNGTGRIQSALASAWQKRHKGRGDMQSHCKAGRAGAHRPSEALHPTRSSDRGAAVRAGARPTAPQVRKRVDRGPARAAAGLLHLPVCSPEAICGAGSGHR
jgi:hypothetical protein